MRRALEHLGSCTCDMGGELVGVLERSENALLYGHPLIESDLYAVEIGVLAKVNAIRHAPGDESLPKIEPPVELPKPLFAHFDEEIANAIYVVLSAGDTSA